MYIHIRQDPVILHFLTGNLGMQIPQKNGAESDKNPLHQITYLIDCVYIQVVNTDLEPFIFAL